MRADGTDEQRLTFTSQTEQSPSWSPDGSRIAYESNGGGRSLIWVMNADGSGQTPLSPDPGYPVGDSEPAWSPDGNLIAFASTRAGTWNLWVMNADGSGLRKVSGVFATEPTWSPDGRQLAYAGTSGIGVVGLDGSNPHLVSGAGGFASGPSWSPDGREIVFSRNNAAGYPGELHVVNADGSGEHQLTSDGFANADPSWSPDGSQIVFQRTSMPSGPWALWAIAADGSGLRQVTIPNGGSDLVPDWGSSQVSPVPAPQPGAPTIQFFSPANGAVYAQGMQVPALYLCSSAVSFVVSCQGDVGFGALLDLSPPGTKTFTVRAVDLQGRTTTAHVTYQVLDLVPPEVHLRTPADGATYTVGALVTIDFSCADPNGSGVAFCMGDRPNGAPLDTAQAGRHTFNVLALDNAGNFAQATATYTVATLPQAISFAPLPDRTYGDHAFALAATGGSSGIPVYFSASGQCSLAGSMVTITGTGTCTVTAHLDGNANYQAAPDVTQSFAIAPAAQAITFGALPTQIVDDNNNAPDLTVTATASSGLGVGFAATGICTMLNANTVHLTGIGSCTITASQPGNANYRAAASVQQSFTVLRALVMGPQAMEGDLKVAPGTTISAGYDFAMPGQHPAVSVTFIQPHVVFVWTCVAGSGTGNFSVSMPNSSYPDAADSNAWYPSGDHSSQLVYQGSFTVPDYCQGGQVRLKSGGTFLTGIMSSDHTDKVSVRWHYNANGSSGGWGATSSIVPNTG